MQHSPSTTHVTAWLPDGRHFLPGCTSGEPNLAACPGPDRWGLCPQLAAGQTPACAGATWFVHAPGRRSWRFRFRSEPEVCPLVLLDPITRSAEVWGASAPSAALAMKPAIGTTAEHALQPRGPGSAHREVGS